MIPPCSVIWKIVALRALQCFHFTGTPATLMLVFILYSDLHRYSSWGLNTAKHTKQDITRNVT